jgi:hypothetical protein
VEAVAMQIEEENQIPERMFLTILMKKMTNK